MKFPKEYLEIARIDSWLGWIFCFGLGNILSLPSPERFMVVFFGFLSATASIFILNQYFDQEEDKRNTLKSCLPLPSGKITPRAALALSFSLMILCTLLVCLAATSLTALFLLYLALWAAYSGPPFRFKSVPIVDFVSSGVGAGFLPFLIGVCSSSQSNFSISLVLMCGVPLMLVHSGGHILQALGDYEADYENRVQTFVVRYGRKKGIIMIGLLFLAAGFFPLLLYAAFGLAPPSTYSPIFFFPLPFCIPIAKHYAIALKNPTAENVVHLQKTAKRCGIIVMVMVIVYVLVGKILGL